MHKLTPDTPQLRTDDHSMNDDSSSRRSFLKTASVATAAITIIPRHVLGQGQTPPSQKLNIAAIGLGGMGSGDVASCAEAGENIVALCDPDKNHMAANAKKYPGAICQILESPRSDSSGTSDAHRRRNSCENSLNASWHDGCSSLWSEEPR